MRKLANTKTSVVKRRGPLQDQTNVPLKNIKTAKNTGEIKTDSQRCTRSNQKNCKHEKKEDKGSSENKHVLGLEPLVKSSSNYAKMTKSNVVSTRSNMQKENNNKRLLRRRRPLDEQNSCNKSNIRSMANPEKIIQKGFDNVGSPKHLKSPVVVSQPQLKLVLERLSPVDYPELVNQEASNTPKSILKKLDPIEISPKFQGFTETEKKKNSLTPKSLKVLLNRISSCRSSEVVSNHRGHRNDLNISKEGSYLTVSLVDITTSSTGSPNRSLNKSCNPKTLQINLEKNSKLERILLTQTDTSPEFYGFDKNQFSPSQPQQHLTIALDNICTYLTTLRDQEKEISIGETGKEKNNENTCKQKTRIRRNVMLPINEKYQEESNNNKNKVVEKVCCNKVQMIKYNEQISKTVKINTQPKKMDVRIHPSSTVKQPTYEAKTKEPEIQCQLNLRKLSNKNYCEESTIDSAGETTEVPSTDKKVPVYLRKIPEGKKTKQNEDEYEFTDISPIKKFKKNNQKRSSGYFDKDTHQVLKRLEKKEKTVKRKQLGKNNKIVLKNDSKQKSYKKIVDNIVSNVLEKVKHRNSLSPIKKVPNEPLASRDNRNIITVDETVCAEPILMPEQNVINNKVPQSRHDRIEIQKPNDIARKDVMEMKTNEQVPEKRRDNVFAAEESTNLTDAQMAKSNLNFSQTSRQLNELNRSYNDRTLVENDIDNCFGFDQEPNIPIPHCSSPINPRINLISNVPIPVNCSSPIRSNINLISNVVVNCRVEQPVLDSPVNFNVRRPNANSTMLGNNLGMNVTHRRKLDSPWRLDLRNIRQNPHFVSIKSNALPRIDQEMVLDHTLVDEFESHCTKTPRIDETKRSPIQQSILNYVECDDDILEKENMNIHKSSLFDCEAFNSPVKKTTNKNDKVQAVKRRILEDVVQSTKVFEHQHQNDESNDLTYFGFDDESLNNKQNSQINRNVDKASKPSRFDPNTLKKYVPKKKSRKAKLAPVPVVDVPSVSILNVTNDDDHDSQADNGEIRLFEEPEELFDDNPVEIPVKRMKRARAASVEDLDDTVRKHKKHKKTHFEIEQEKWMQSFNKELEEIDRMDLETE